MLRNDNLNKIIAEFLSVKFSQDTAKEHAQALIDLMKLEGHWQHEQKWNEKKGDKVIAHEMKPSDIKTVRDLIYFIQMTGQSNWFGGHDRLAACFDDGAKKKKQEEYFNLFQSLQLTEAVDYNKEQDKPIVSAVFGALESRVKLRVATLENLLRKGIFPTTNLICGLGANRPLQSGLEKESIDKLQAANLPLTEMSMVELLITEMLNKLKTEDRHKYGKLSFVPINTVTAGVALADPTRAKTGDTAKSLSELIQKLASEKKASSETKLEQKEIIIGVFDQPFIVRMEADANIPFENTSTKVIGVGSALTKQFFFEYPQSISVCLGEAARLVNTKFTSLRSVLESKEHEKYARELTKEEMAELRGLISPSVETTMRSEASVVAFSMYKAVKADEVKNAEPAAEVKKVM